MRWNWTLNKDDLFLFLNPKNTPILDILQKFYTPSCFTPHSSIKRVYFTDQWCNTHQYHTTLNSTPKNFCSILKVLTQQLFVSNINRAQDLNLNSNNISNMVGNLLLPLATITTNDNIFKAKQNFIKKCIV